MGIETGLALLGSALGASAASATAVGALAAGGLGAAGLSAYSANKQAGAQKDATAEATKQAKLTADAATEATNRANQKRPDSMAALSGAQGMAKGGAAGTMLTGPNGIDPTSLQLGKTTLLGA